MTRLDFLARKFLSPRSWSIRTRRIVLLTLPLALPLYLVGVALVGFLLLLRRLWHPIAWFWSAPPVRRRGDSYYDYGRRRGEVVPIAERDAA